MIEKGLGVYQGGEGSRRPGVKQIFEAILKKSALRAALELETAKINEALPYLNATETQQLSEMLQDETVANDAEVAALAATVDREVALAASTRAMDIRLDRGASQVLQSAMLRQIDQHGFCKAPSQLAGEAITLVYGGGR